MKKVACFPLRIIASLAKHWYMIPLSSICITNTFSCKFCSVFNFAKLVMHYTFDILARVEALFRFAAGGDCGFIALAACIRA